MRITKGKLRQIIREELSRFHEQSKRYGVVDGPEAGARSSAQVVMAALDKDVHGKAGFKEKDMLDSKLMSALLSDPEIRRRAWMSSAFNFPYSGGSSAENYARPYAFLKDVRAEADDLIGVTLVLPGKASGVEGWHLDSSDLEAARSLSDNESPEQILADLESSASPSKLKSFLSGLGLGASHGAPSRTGAQSTSGGFLGVPSWSYEAIEIPLYISSQAAIDALAMPQEGDTRSPRDYDTSFMWLSEV